MSHILVAFATKAGSTGEVAAAIARTLEECGDTVELRRARDVREPVSGWDCVVLGAPIYSGRWHRHAHRFLKRHRRELTPAVVAVFGGVDPPNRSHVPMQDMRGWVAIRAWARWVSDLASRRSAPGAHV